MDIAWFESGEEVHIMSRFGVQVYTIHVFWEQPVFNKLT